MMHSSNPCHFFQYFPIFSKITNKGLYFISRDTGKVFASYLEIHRQALGTAESLKKMGIKEGDRVALILPNGQDFVRLFLGLMVLGAVPTALYPPLVLARIDDYLVTLEEQLKILDARCLITFKAVMGPIGNVTAKLKINLYGPSSFPVEKRVPDFQAPKNKIAFIQFSSGTTGASKPALITHEHLANNIESIIEGLQLKEGIDSGVSWLPLYHDMGLVGGFFTALATKSDMTILRPEEFLANPALWFQTIHDSRATITVAPNFAFGFAAQKIKDEDLQKWDLSCLRVALCGAEQVSHETMQMFIRKFSPAHFKAESLLPVYGMSEATLALAFPRVHSGAKFHTFDLKALAQGSVVSVDNEGPSSNSVKLACVGKAVKNVEIQIRDEENQLAVDGMAGNIWAKGNAIIDYYLSGPLPKEQDFFFTGDRGFIFQGELYIAGRSKDILIVRGKNIDASFAESILYEFKQFRTGRWAIRADLDERIFVLAEIRKPLNEAEQAKLRDEVVRRMAQKIGIVPHQVVFLAPASLPRTTSGKIRRQKALELFLEGNLQTRQARGFMTWPKFFFYAIKGFLALKVAGNGGKMKGTRRLFL